MSELNSPDAETDGKPREGLRGALMGSSSGSNNTFAFDEAGGILNFLRPGFLRSKRRLKSRQQQPQHHGGPATVAKAPRTGGMGSGAVRYDDSSDTSDSSSSSTNAGSSNFSDGSSSTAGTEADRGRRAATRGARGRSPPILAASAPPDTDKTALAHLHADAGPVPVHGPSQASSDTEYAPPSDEGRDGADAAVASAVPRRQLHGAPTETSPDMPPPSNALRAGGPAATPRTRSRLSSPNHHHQAAPAPTALAGRRGSNAMSTGEEDEKEGNSGSGSSRGGADSDAASSGTSDEDSDSDDVESDDEDAEADLGQAYSKASGQSEAPSSRLRHDGSVLHGHHGMGQGGAGAFFAAPVRDVRSSLVSTIDVDAAVVQRRRRRQQHDLYLQATLHPASTPHSATTPGSSPAPSLTEPLRRFLAERAEAPYRRHMEALVEHYLSAPKYTTALAQYRKHLPLEEQLLRTRDAQVRYAAATEMVLRPPRADGTATATPASGAAQSGVGVYRLEKTDLELLAGDMARRARLLDDTLPWRPIDFDDTGIRLEPLEHQQTDITAADMLAGSGAAPAVGGSVNLLIEVLILTEMDVPFTSTIPMVNYTNVFLLLASLFVQTEVLVTKLIRLYRSVRAWEAEVEDTARAAYLERRILQCLLVYCRVHETDLNLTCLRRLAHLAASEGFVAPLNALDDAVGKDRWPCQEGAQTPERRRAAAWAAAVSAGASTTASPTTTTTAAAAAAAAAQNGSGNAAAPTQSPLRQLKRYGFQELPRHHGAAGAAGAASAAVAFDFPVFSATQARVPLQHAVAQTMLEFTVYLQRTSAAYYRPIEVSPACVHAVPFPLAGPRRVFVDAAALRPSLGCTYSSPHSPMAADPALEDDGPDSSTRGNGNATASGAASGDYRSPRAASPARMSASASNPYRVSPIGAESTAFPTATATPSLSQQQQQAGRPADGPGASTAAAQSVHAGKAAGSPSAGLAAGAVLTEKPLLAVDIEMEHLSHQICLLSFSLFAAVHIRELLNNAWTDAVLKHSVCTRLSELMDFSVHLQRWVAAVIVAPSTWLECQRGLRHFLEVCRMLYEQQNYEMASAVLDGLRHPAVEAMERVFEEVRGQGLLTPVERREMETLLELMDPFASYSPSSLYSVAARTVGDMETPMIPLLAPILGVIFRSEDAKGPTVTIRASDGQAVVNWSKLIGLGKMLVLWMRCQYTPYTFSADPAIQEYLWSITYHQWTDAHLMRAARRVKK